MGVHRLSNSLTQLCNAMVNVVQWCCPQSFCRFGDGHTSNARQASPSSSSSATHVEASTLSRLAPSSPVSTTSTPQHQAHTTPTPTPATAVAANPTMTGTRFMKLVKDCGLVSRRLTTAQAELVFAQSVCGSRRMDFEEFQEAIEGLARVMFPTHSLARGVRRVERRMCKCPGPRAVATVRCHSPPRDSCSLVLVGGALAIRCLNGSAMGGLVFVWRRVPCHCCCGIDGVASGAASLVWCVPTTDAPCHRVMVTQARQRTWQ